MLTLLPWHQSPWSNIVRARRAGRLAHGLLLKEPAGAGAYEFARFLGSSLLCLNPHDDFLPCGTCKSCALYEAGNHTDCQLMQPEEQGKQIKVEQIRALIDFFTLKSQFEGYKVAIIKPADAMNRSAANTLLKTLEEPPPLSILILVTQRPERLPVTLRSRCQQITFQPDFTERARAWLADKINNRKLADELLVIAKGAPLTALNMYENSTLDKLETVLDDMVRLSKLREDPLKTAKHWDDLGAEQVMLWILQTMADMIRLKAGNAAGNVNPSEAWKRLQMLTNGLDLYKLMASYDLLMRNYRLCTGQISYDSQGLLEEFVIQWQQTTATV
jgi:DNA polymerase-3 subunit delta'